MELKFKPGHEVMTNSVAEWCDPSKDGGAIYSKLLDCFKRHLSGDWGDLCEEDKKENDFSLKNGLRLLSAYEIEGQRIWIITEADRSVTTILFPSDY